MWNLLTFVPLTGGVAMASSGKQADPSTVTPLPSAETPLEEGWRVKILNEVWKKKWGLRF